MKDITAAKRLIAASSMEGMRLLGAGVSKPCFQGRYNAAARAALEDPTAQLSAAERRLIAEFIEGEEATARDYTLRVRLLESERAELERLSEAAGLTMSEYVRQATLGRMEFEGRIV